MNTNTRKPLDLAQFEGKAADFMQAGQLIAEVRRQREQIELLKMRLFLQCEFTDCMKDCIPDWRERMKITEEGYTANSRAALKGAE